MKLSVSRNYVAMCIAFYYLCISLCCAGTIDDWSRSVVFLRQTIPVKEDVNGAHLEVWYKSPNTNIFTQKLSFVSGSGLIVISSNVCYLITARHVAQNMTEDCEIVMRGDKTEPVHFKLSSITGQPAVRWFHHKDADISIHPLPTITPEGLNALNHRAFPIELLDSQTNLPSRDTTLTALGFPLGLGAEGEFVPPVTRL